jgi:hypothetical protein
MRSCHACESCSKSVCTCRSCKHIYSLKNDDLECHCGLRKRKCPYDMNEEKWAEEMRQSQ